MYITNVSDCVLILDPGGTYLLFVRVSSLSQSRGTLSSTASNRSDS